MTQKETHKLTLKDFANLFGAETRDILKDCRILISKIDSDYRKFNTKERDRIILDILKKIESGDFSIAGEQKQSRWKDGWQEILERFIKSNYNITTLTPQYDAKPARVLRFNQDYIMPKDPMFEMQWLNIFLMWFFKKYFTNVDTIYEFGFGTGRNLVILANLFPQKKLYGLEWVKAPLDIIKLLAKKHHFNIKGRLFNIFQPDDNLRFSPNSAILTRATLEQIGPNYEKFLNFLLKKAPALCVHIEPIVELYDEHSLVDYLAIKLHKKRNYLNGYLDRLIELSNEGKIEIIKIQKVSFGSLYLDPYSYIVWKPKIYKNNLTKTYDSSIKEK